MSDKATVDDIQHLRDQLQQKDAQVQQAAQAGLELLNQIAEMQTRFEEQRTEMTSALEDLQQDKYTLKKEVALKTQQIKSLQWEAEHLEKRHRQNIDDENKKLQMSHQMDLEELNKKMILLQSALDESRLTEKQTKEKLELQTEVLNSKMEELRILNEHTQSSPLSESVDMHKVLELENIKLELEWKHKESQHREQQLQLINSSLQDNLKLTTEERNKDAATWCAALEKSREMNRELQDRLETVLQQAQDPNSKGNSLFAELEDKRAEMEKKLKNMKVQYESLQTQYDFNKQQLQRMKVHIATLMQLRCSRVDPSQMERLQSLLSEKTDEIHNLMTKLQKLEKVELLLKTQSNNPPRSETGNGQEETFYIDLLKMQLDNAMKDVERLVNELSLVRMKSLSESQKVLQLERKLFAGDRLLKQAESDKIQLQLQVEHLQEKYEPKKTTKLSQGGKNEKLPVNTLSSFEATEPIKSKKISKESGISLCPETGSEKAPESAKHVKICEDNPVLIPNPRSPGANCKEENHEQKENVERKKNENVKVMHVCAQHSMETQCSQQ
ncbi:protein Spindly [Corythoichthys intestinalis]|uniref:protein Spindly n=1 Tax=Corythoichthys intestinalis TaxID=161448 RepID=UPI0025A63D95|nr:protein Spindly [Corythoichthys intestinalis]